MQNELTCASLIFTVVLYPTTVKISGAQVAETKPEAEAKPAE